MGEIQPKRCEGRELTTERFLADIQWPGAAAFARAERSVWRLTPADPEVAG